ncbi:hypothetical protein M0804_013860 [Polistes exclamans]|nr:hypothetical protein M0804_013865 [Polistes exclamans]KAI4476107.1 hypothetical protein M0804_013860 [Polistes exclamans]
MICVRHFCLTSETQLECATPLRFSLGLKRGQEEADDTEAPVHHQKHQPSAPAATATAEALEEEEEAAATLAIALSDHPRPNEVEFYDDEDEDEDEDDKDEDTERLEVRKRIGFFELVRLLSSNVTSRKIFQSLWKRRPGGTTTTTTMWKEMPR